MMTEDTIRTKDLYWTNIVNPSEEILESLQKKYGFHDLDLGDCLSRTESPKIESYSDYVFIVFHFPSKKTHHKHISIESLNIFMSEKFIITLGDGKLQAFNDFFQALKEKPSKRKTLLKKGSGYLLYMLIHDLFDLYSPYISQLNRSIREIEEDIFGGMIQKDRLYDIMRVKREIITLKRAISPHSDVIYTLEHLHKRFIDEHLELYFDDIGDKITRDKSNLSSMDEMIETLHNANESLTSHNTNKVMKILTIFSVTMLPLTFMTGLYGMNVKLPLAANDAAFIWLVLIMLGGLILMLLFFRVMKYL